MSRVQPSEKAALVHEPQHVSHSNKTDPSLASGIRSLAAKIQDVILSFLFQDFSKK